jgi:hypothetical protein
MCGRPRSCGDKIIDSHGDQPNCVRIRGAAGHEPGDHAQAVKCCALEPHQLTKTYIRATALRVAALSVSRVCPIRVRCRTTCTDSTSHCLCVRAVKHTMQQHLRPELRVQGDAIPTWPASMAAIAAAQPPVANSGRLPEYTVAREERPCRKLKLACTIIERPAVVTPAD